MPAAFCRNRRASACSRVRATTAPPTVALWPSKYLVVLWIDMSAPSSSGRWKYGVKNVLSTAWGMPWARAISEIAARSVSLSVGLAGVSVRISLVVLRKARRTSSVFDVSANAISTPNRLSTRVQNRCVPP